MRNSSLIAVLASALVLAPLALPGHSQAARASEASVVLEGLVLAPDGLPAVGAEVRSSAGGTCLVDADGNYRLELCPPAGATHVEVTSGASASTTVALGAGGSIRVPTLRQSLGGACTPAWIPTFGGLPGVAGEVKDCVTFDAGTGPELYVGGWFWNAGGTGAVNVAHWNGSRWASTGSVLSYGANDIVMALAVLEPEGGSPVLLAAGQSGGGLLGTIVQWDGSSWTPFAEANAQVNDLLVGDDGTLYAGGEFTSIDGVEARHVARWNGSAWEPLGIGRPGAINALVIHDDGTGPALYAASAGVAKWNGSSWQILGGPTGPTLSTVSNLETFGGDLYAGGGFTIIGGVPAQNIARWNGLAWSALPPNALGASIGAEFTVFNDGEGPALFTTANLGGSTLARWDGTAWTLVGGPAPYDIYCLHAFDDLGPNSGLFTSFTNFFLPGEPAPPASQIARFDGSEWSALGNGLSRLVGPVAEHVDAGTKRLAGVVGPFRDTYVATWNESEWVPLGSGSFNAPVEVLESIDLGAGPALYAAGQFTQVGSLVARVVRWTPTGWVNVGDGLSNTVKALVGHDDGTGLALHAAGLFSLGGGQSSGVMRWNGVAWSPLGSGWNGQVTALGTFDDGSGMALYAGGSFTLAGGVPANRIARWDGTSWSPLGPGFASGDVSSLVVFDDGSGPALYAGGFFQNAGGADIDWIARWDGTTWSAVGSLNQSVLDLATFDDGTGPALFAGGRFTLADGLAIAHIAKWNGVDWSPLGSGLLGPRLSPDVTALWFAVVGDGANAVLHAGGPFYAPDSQDSFVATWACAPPDETPPVLSCPTAAAALDRFPGGTGEVVHFSVSAVDAFDPAPEVTCTPPSGSVFPVGTTTVTCTATDASGNQSTCEFPLTVQPKAKRR